MTEVMSFQVSLENVIQFKLKLSAKLLLER